MKNCGICGHSAQHLYNMSYYRQLADIRYKFIQEHSEGNEEIRKQIFAEFKH